MLRGKHHIHINCGQARFEPTHSLIETPQPCFLYFLPTRLNIQLVLRQYSVDFGVVQVLPKVIFCSMEQTQSPHGSMQKI
jgi:hypothetical protein